MSIRIGADVGGTFTDIVIEVADGSYSSTKVLTTHDAPEVGILDGIGRIAAQENIDLRDVTQIIHGTTLATNALIERRGAKTALVTTDGFRDVIETRTESRFEQYDLNIVLPTPSSQRADRHVISERLNARGEILVPFDENGARSLVEHIGTEGYQSVAVGFIHSYVNPTNELRFRELLLAELPDIAVSISSEVSPQMREYERFNTVCANAYVQPLMASYLVRLRDELAARGATPALPDPLRWWADVGRVGRCVPRPARGVGAGRRCHLRRRSRRPLRPRPRLSYDMGGTTAKIALIEDFTPATAKTFEVDRTARFKKGSGMPISIPVIEMIEIGAAGFDRFGRFARPDPHRPPFGRQRARAGVLWARRSRRDRHRRQRAARSASPRHVRGEGHRPLPALAAEALMRSVGDRLGLSAADAARGVAEVVDENMTNAARVHAVENGKDLAGYSMIAFGGGGPLHAGRLLDKLGSMS